MELPPELMAELRHLATAMAQVEKDLDRLIPETPPVNPSLRCDPVEPSPHLASELEAELRRLPGVLNARVVAGEDGALRELHIVADRTKTPKQVVRDVTTLAQARFAVDLDHRMVSVVQLAQAPEAGPEPPPRPADPGGGRPAPPESPTRVRLESTVTGHRASQFHAEVTLGVNGSSKAGTAEGGDTTTVRPRVLALATLAALANLLERFGTAEIDSAAVVRLGDRDVAVVALNLMAGDRNDTVVGSALVGPAGADVATARAVLDAVNRRLRLPPRDLLDRPA